MTLFFYIGGGMMVVGAIGLLIAAFRTSFLWGLGCLLIPLVSLIFLFVHWSEAKNPFFLYLAGMALLAIGAPFLSHAR